MDEMPNEDALLSELGRSTDLRSLVQRVCQNKPQTLVVSSAAVTAWKQRDPRGWAKVCAWLANKGVTITTP